MLPGSGVRVSTLAVLRDGEESEAARRAASASACISCLLSEWLFKPHPGPGAVRRWALPPPLAEGHCPGRASNASIRAGLVGRAWRGCGGRGRASALALGKPAPMPYVWLPRREPPVHDPATEDDGPRRPRRHGGMVEVPNPLSSTWLGRIAQLVEQLTLNQRVPGSSPGAPTKFPYRSSGWTGRSGDDGRQKKYKRL